MTKTVGVGIRKLRGSAVRRKEKESVNGGTDGIRIRVELLVGLSCFQDKVVTETGQREAENSAMFSLPFLPCTFVDEQNTLQVPNCCQIITAMV